MPRKRWTLEEKLKIVLKSLESPKRRAEIRRQYRISDGTLEAWREEVSKSPNYWRRLPRLPEIQDEFRSKYERHCLKALKGIVVLVERLIARVEATTTEFLQKHEWFCMYSLDCRGITNFSFFPPEGGYDIEKIYCKELASTLKASVRKVHHHLSCYAQELRSKYPHLDTKCVRLGQRTFLLYTSRNCKPLPRNVLRNLVRVKDEIDWIPTMVSPDPFYPKDKIKINFDSYVATDDGTVTTLEYLIRPFKEMANNLRTIEETDEQREELIERIEHFTNFYSRFV